MPPIDSASARFDTLVDRGDSPGACWVWQGTKTKNGYGQFTIGGGSRADRRRVYAHRWSYERANGEIPPSLTIDHRCRNRACVNPDHLDAVTLAENHARRRGIKTGPYEVGATCSRGHLRSPENTRINKRGARVCVLCGRIATAESKRRRQLTTIE